MPINRVAVLITSFNRRESTLKSLAALHRQRTSRGIEMSVFLVDDGCTDGTGEAALSRFSGIRVLRGDGKLFWNGGMRMAFAAALRESYDAYLLLNDDTVLCADALERMSDCAEAREASGKPSIVVGSTRSPLTGEHSYGGMALRTKGLAIVLEKVPPHPSHVVVCDTMNGNVVLIPRQIAEIVGNLEERFHHQFGDIDYGLRAKKSGFAVVIAPGYVADCLSNSRTGTWRDPRASFKQRWISLISPKGVPAREWVLFTRRHYGWRWFYYSLSPYVKTILFGMLGPRNLQDVNQPSSARS
jgi:GT2 family glycosyltransferase